MIYTNTHVYNIRIVFLASIFVVCAVSLAFGKWGALIFDNVGAPQLQSATIGTSGTTLTLVFDRSVTVPQTNNDNFWLSVSVGHPTLAYSSGSGSDTLVYDISRTIYSAETPLLEYERYTIDNLTDFVYSATDVLSGSMKLADFSGVAITNNSTQTYTPSGTEITSADKAADGVIYLETQDTTYYLGEDISGDGASVAICASGIVFDGNFHSITDTSANLVTNGDFSSGTTGWDFSNAANASVFTTSDYDADYLLNKLVVGTTNSVEFTDSTATEYVESTGTVSLEAGVTYIVSAMCMYGTDAQDSANPTPAVSATAAIGNPATITSSEAHGLTTGDTVELKGFTGASEALNGEHTVTVTSTTEFTVPVNVSSLPDDSGTWEWGAAEAIEFYVQALDGGTPITGRSTTSILSTGLSSASKTDGFIRGIQLIEYMITPGSATNATIRFGINGHKAGYKNIYFGDIRVCRAKRYGVACSLSHDSVPEFYMPAYDTSGTHGSGVTTGVTIKNVKITKPSGSGWGHGIYMNKTDDATVENCTIDVSGNNASCIGELAQVDSDRLVTVDNCEMSSNITALSSRDNNNGAMISQLRGTITDNYLHDGPHTGIEFKCAESVISRNRITLENRYSNGCAIMGYSGGSTTYTTAAQVTYNTIVCNEGLEGCPALFKTGQNYATYAYNHVNTRLRSRNQEYGTVTNGDQLSGCYGCQLEGTSYGTIHDNFVAVNTYYGEGFALRYNGESATHIDNEFYNNTWVCLLEATQYSGVSSGKDVAAPAIRGRNHITNITNFICY